MNKIIFEFSETRPNDTNMTIEATNAEILLAAAALVSNLIDSIQENTGILQAKVEEQILTRLRKAIRDIREEARTDNKQWEISNE